MVIGSSTAAGRTSTGFLDSLTTGASAGFSAGSAGVSFTTGCGAGVALTGVGATGAGFV